MQETRRNNGGMASELGHKYVIVHIKGERTKQDGACAKLCKERGVSIKAKEEISSTN